MTNPNKYIRKAIIGAIGGGVRVWYKRIPKDVKTPKEYILINSQSKQRAWVSKDCYDWSCQVNIDCYVITEQGMPPTVAIDDLEEIVLNAMENLQIEAPFWIYSVKLEDQIDLSDEKDSKSIERRVLVYELWINKA